MSRRAARSRAAAAQRRARRRTFLAVIAVVVGVLVIAAAVLVLLGGNRGLDKEAAAVQGYSYPSLQMFPPDPGGRRHLAAGESYDNYNSNPPTSGPHASATATPGVHDEPVPKEMAVHNMEHGQVVVWYNCIAPQPLNADACNTLKQSLAGVVSEANNRGKRVVTTPYSAMDYRIALTAWQFLDGFGEFDAQHVRTFIDTFYCHTNLEGFC